MENTHQRHLAAIMFTDIVGYSALAQKNEALSLELLEEHRGLLRPIFARFGGKEIETIGDAFFLKFASALEAVKCAFEIQFALFGRNSLQTGERKIVLRIGIHLGDVMQMGDKVHGDGVNIASRIQTAARPGGICISDHVYMQVRDKLELEWQSRGELELKNIERPMEVFDVIFAWEKEQPAPSKSKSKAKTSSNTNSGAGKYLWPAVALAAVILIAGYFWTKKGQPRPYPEATPSVVSAPPELASYDSIAVLPFDNLSDDRDNAYFARGIHEDILTSLSKVKALKVISRTSVMEYENKTRNLKKIAEDLGVATILEGSVRRSGLRVRISAQLIDANTDEHLWAENYDRDLTDIFALQSTIAEEIVEALKTTLTPEEKKSIESVPTQNTQAYDIYLKARDYYSLSFENRDSAATAERLYNRAIKLDPSFALAYAALSQLHGDLYWFVLDHTEERLQKAKTAVDHALRLQPDLTEGQIALAYYYYQGFRDYARTQEILEKVSQSEPNNAEVYALLAYTQRRQGLWDKCLTNLKKAVKLDPRNPDYWRSLAQTYEALGQYPLAVEHFEKTIELTPESLIVPIFKGYLYMNWKGDTSAMKGVLEDIPSSMDLQGNVSYARWWVHLWERDYQGALAALWSYSEEVYDFQDTIFHKEYLKGELYLLMGEKEKARIALEASLEYLEPAAVEHRDDPRYHSALGFAYARLGRKEAAIREGFEAVKLMPIAKDALDGPGYARDLALIYALVGETEQAIDELENLLSLPASITREQLRNSPHWDPLRDNLRFQALLEEGNGNH